ncbi:MAG: hypothetical protein HXX12_13810 [Geothrix sp.]|uniref:hypothetical protein n=1 Tax=Geothrix sp. TaxID=1962974 RepID=UPI0017A274B3|nr:hypothetical protein [Geothrix sp.]NWJ42034.1 hypothetical protein [Geothrix sp.]WIL19998.1 MAG: hypothetical protein QOZ81_002538 [Geothrix sp.]
MIDVVQATFPDWKRFAALPRRLYDGDAAFSPVPDPELRAWFAGSHPCSPFLRFQAFLARRGGRTVGRCAAFINARLPVDGAPLGTLGLYECEADDAAAAALLAGAQDWLREQGCAMAWGPMNGSIWTGYRFLTSGSGHSTFHGEPAHKPWYPGQFSAAGFKPIRRWHSLFLPPAEARLLRDDQVRLAASARARGFRIRHPDPARVDAELASIHAIIEDSYTSFLGFSSLAPGEFSDLYRGLTAVWNPELIQIAVDPQGRDVGFNIVLPDPGRGLRAMRGRSSLLARLRYLLAREANPAHVDLYLGIRREAGHLGVGSLLTHAACHNAIEAEVPFIIALVAEETSFASVEARFPHVERHEYHLYARSLVP